ncbi:hypothetical protein [Shewanella khirikhana]|uniref:Uncharacterized protein n=1 Tax=Shewanella khirikhana TaxID=1965282 RepID=A0ABM7DNU3_9GAMM|nr:hypothetical protein [Shewanella khirikhana]AZQ11181.1 hypothetical protein STH12_02094 [Shewanella khirikhana]
MNQDLSVRSLLVDKGTGKYIKAVDERDLSDFLPLLAQEDSSSHKVTVYDFKSVVEYYHNELEGKLVQRENKELAVKRATVFNTWMRLRTITHESMLCQMSAQLLRDAEEVSNWIHTRLPELKRTFQTTHEGQNYHKNEKTEALLRLSDDIEVFIEVLLCNIHTTAGIDINSIKSDYIITEHCNSIRNLIVDLLKSESDFYNGEFNWNSIMHSACMENIGFNPDAIVHLLEAKSTVQDIKNNILKNANYEDVYGDGRWPERKYSVTWPKADPNRVDRVKILARLLENINSVMNVLEKLKLSDVSNNQDQKSQESFENEIQKLLPQRNITSGSR